MKQKAFTEFLESDFCYNEAIDIVRSNCLGRIWLIGGSVYRNLVCCLYGTRPSEFDFDFIVEKPNSEIVLPVGWQMHTNRYNNPKFVGSGNIDFIPLNNINSILRRKLEPTIENYLTGTPLTVQSICYDVGDKELIGDIGIKAINEKTVGINNSEQAKIYSAKKGRSIEEIIKRKAESLGFAAVF